MEIEPFFVNIRCINLLGREWDKSKKHLCPNLFLILTLQERLVESVLIM